MSYEVILLDADNTLLDFDKDMENAIRKLFIESKIPYNAENLKLYSKYNHMVWDMFDKKEITQERLQVMRFELLLNHFKELKLKSENLNYNFISYLGEGRALIEGAVEVCAELSKDKTLVIGTNGIYRSQIERISKSPLAPYIDEIVISEEIGYQKPDKEFFNACLEIVNCNNKKKALMVGDSLVADIKGANSFGIDTCWYNPNKLPCPCDIEPKYIISDLKELLEII